MTASVVAYMGHPIGETNGYGAVQRADNLSNAMEWVRFFNDLTRWSIVCPWHLNAVAIGDDAYGPRRLMSQLAVLERSDIYIAVGGYPSPHMLVEMRHAKRYGVPIVDVTSMGVVPPGLDDVHAETLRTLAGRAIASRPRRVWMPLLTAEDLKSLARARHTLYIDTIESHDREVEIIDRIMQAAALSP